MNPLLQSLWSANTVSGRLLVLLIVVVVGLAIVQARRGFARYGRELAQIAGVRRHLAEWRSSPVAAPTPSHEPQALAEGEEPSEVAGSEDGDSEVNPVAAPLPERPGLVDMDQLCAAVDPASLIGDRIGAIGQMRRYRVKVDLDTLQELALYRDASMPGQAHPAFAAGFSLMLGILGTFLGLAAMVQEIHLGLPSDTSSLTAEAWVSAADQLASVLGGMKTAFSTSIIGVAGALICSALAFRLGQERRRVFEALERLTAAELIPATVPAVQDEDLLAEVTRRLDESFTLLEDIHAQNRESLKDLTAAQQACATVVDQVRDITRGQAARNLDEILGQLGRSNQAVLEVSRQIPRVVSAVESTARAVRDAAAGGLAGGRWKSATSGGSGAVFGLRPAAWIAILVGLAAILGLAHGLNAL